MKKIKCIIERKSWRRLKWERERARENLSRRIGIAIVQQDAIVQQEKTRKNETIKYEQNNWKKHMTKKAFKSKNIENKRKKRKKNKFLGIYW